MLETRLEGGKHVSRVNDNDEHCARQTIRFNCPLVVFLLLGVSRFEEYPAFRMYFDFLHVLRP